MNPPELSLKARRLLRRVQAHLRKHPETYDQSHMAMSPFSPPCGCIMSHVYRIAGSEEAYMTGLSHDQSDRLIRAGFWPTRFYRTRTYDLCAGKRIRASTAIARIDHFIATDGRE